MPTVRAVSRPRVADRVARDFLAPDRPVLVARAPGRLDVMGGIADYSGALVLQLPLDRATSAMLQPIDEPLIEIASTRAGGMARFTMPLDALLHGELRSPERLASWLAEEEGDHWAAYIVGVAHACLVRRPDVPRPAGGFRLLVRSDVPEGKGISSSAALEVACLSAIAARYGVHLSGEELATACQWAENHIAGAPCGIMDQMTSACGRRGHLLRLRCQPGTVEGHLSVPDGYRFYGIDSGIRHAVTGADYGTVRTAAFMGYRMIAELAGLPVERDGPRVRVDDPRWNGYLANLTPDELTSRYADALPAWMSGAEFLERYQGITDRVTTVRPERSYPVRQATAHPVHENARVERFAALLGAADFTDRHAVEMGALMYASHASYGACGLGSDGTDTLVAMAAARGPSRGVFGAKITGGGSGGTVAVFGSDAAEGEMRSLAAEYEAATGRTAELFTRSGAGAVERGVASVPSLDALEALDDHDDQGTAP
jgi:L-arabinokinase